MKTSIALYNDTNITPRMHAPKKDEPRGWNSEEAVQGGYAKTEAQGMTG
ncbi:hypothetical protein ACEN88_35650 [Massilia sp. CT11-108]